MIARGKRGLRFARTVLGLYWAAVPLAGLTLAAVRVYDPRWLSIVDFRYGSYWVTTHGVVLTVEEFGTLLSLGALVASLLLAVPFHRQRRSVKRLFAFDVVLTVLFVLAGPALGRLRGGLTDLGITTSELTREGTLVTLAFFGLYGLFVYSAAYLVVYRPSWRPTRR